MEKKEEKGNYYKTYKDFRTSLLTSSLKSVCSCPSCHGLPQQLGSLLSTWSWGLPSATGHLKPFLALHILDVFNTFLHSYKEAVTISHPSSSQCLHPLSPDPPPSEPRGWKVRSTVGVSAVPPHGLPSNATQSGLCGIHLDNSGKPPSLKAHDINYIC